MPKRLNELGEDGWEFAEIGPFTNPTETAVSRVVCKSVQPRSAPPRYAFRSMLPDPIRLWATPSGRQCLLSAPDSQPPFKVVVLDGPEVIKEYVFDDHDAAAGFAIAEMRAALNPSQHAD